MRRGIVYIYKAVRNVKYFIVPFLSTCLTRLYFTLNGIEYGSIHCAGIPFVHVSLRGVCRIGKDLTLGSWMGSSASGLRGRCKIEVRNGAVLTIGNSVGMTTTTIICHERVTIGDHVKIGVGVHIFDTDFHAKDPGMRREVASDRANRKTAPILIGNNVFIGAQAIILKGVTIGENAIIGAGSVVTRDVPANAIAAGNPCRVVGSIKPNNIV